MIDGFSDSIRVLHVDDDPEFGTVAAEFLEREDDRFVVETATSAAEGMERLDGADSFDCIVSDYEMPGQDGIEFLESVRAAYPDLPFVLFTGKGSEEVASDAISAGVTEYLQKGSGTDQYTVLANRIENAVKHYRSQRLVERSETRLREIIDSLPHILYVVDADGRYRLANEALADFHDTSVEAIEGAAVDEVLTAREAEQVRADVEAVLAADAEQHVDPVEVTGPDGETHVVEPRMVPFDGIGDSPSVLGVAVDITEQRERERDLRRHERRYRAIFDDPNILVGLLDTDGTVLEINETAMEYVAATGADVTGIPFRDTPWFSHSEPLQERIESWVERAARGEYVEFEADLISPAGEPYMVEGVFRPVTNDDGDVVSVIVSDRDVTERKQREHELEETNALLSTLFETLPVGVFAEDADRNVLAVNDRVLDLFDLSGSSTELIGLESACIDDRLSDAVADPETYRERTRALADQREPARNEKIHLVDGGVLELRYEPIELSDGEGHLWVFSDVTDQQARAARLEALNRTMRDLMTATTRQEVAEIGAEAACDILGMDANTVHVFDEERNVLVPIAATDTVHEMVDEPPAFSAGESIAWRAFENREPLRLADVRDDPDVYNPETDVRSELHLPIGDHGLLLACSQTVSAFDQEDAVLGKLLARNIATALDQLDHTERLRDRERELTEQNDRLEKFASVVSHDLRNPLQVIESQVTLLQDEYDSDRLSAIDRSLDRMDTLIEDLLTLAREGDPLQERESVDLAALLQQCWHTVETGTATLKVETAQTIRADRSRLQQLFENLIRNAVEHGGKDVTITVGDLADGFYVADDGIGIPPEDRETVFELGYSTGDDGTGFGLAIVAEIVEAHGWEIENTESEAGGTRIEITGV